MFSSQLTAGAWPVPTTGHFLQIYGSGYVTPESQT